MDQIENFSHMEKPLLEYRVGQLELRTDALTKKIETNTGVTIATLVTLVGALAWFILSHTKVF